MSQTQAQEQRKPSKIDLKRQQIYMDRMRRHMSSGMSPEDAHKKIAEEDYERLPITEKLERLQSAVASALREISKDVRNLQDNDQVIADAMDVNFRAIATLLDKRLGVSLADQAVEMKKAQEDINAERAAQRVAAEAAAEKEQEKELVAAAATPGEPEPAPEGATVFGG